MATTTASTADSVRKQFTADPSSSHPLALSDDGVQHNSRLLRRRKSMMSVAEGAKSRLTHIPQHRPSDSSSSEETLDPKSSTRRQSLTRATVSSMAKVVPNELKRRNSMMNLSSTTNNNNIFAPSPQLTGSMSILKTSSLLTGDITTGIRPTPRRASMLHPPSRRSTMPVLSAPAPSLPKLATKLQSSILGTRPTPLLNTHLQDSASQRSLRRRASVQNLESVTATTSSAELDTNKPSRCRHGTSNKDPHQPIWLRRQTKCSACNPNPVPQPPVTTPQPQQPSPTSPRTMSPPPTVAATAAAAMAAAAAVVSAAAATAASSGPAMNQQNPKWADLITHCVAHSSRLEKLAQEILGQESRTDRVVSRQASLEDLQQTREEAHQEKIKECESLVKAQRSMLLELEVLLAEFGVSGKRSSSSSSSSNASLDKHTQQEKEEQQQERSGETSLSTPPSSSPSASSSLPSMPPSPTTSYENDYDNRKVTVASPEHLSQQQGEAILAPPASPASTANTDWTQIVDESVSRFRWTVSQWVGGLVGNGQCVKDDGQSMVVSGTAFTKEPNLLPLHLTASTSTQSQSVHYHQYVLEIKPDDRKTRLALLPDAQWTPDAHVNCCEFSYADDKEGKCSTEFNWAVRRHHCRRCGHVFCNAHSSNRLPLFGSAGRNQKPEWSRVCDGCFYTVAGSSLLHPADQPSS